LQTGVQEEEVVVAEISQIESQHDCVCPEGRWQSNYPFVPCGGSVSLVEQDHKYR
jgi:hypothetical protein